MRIGTTNLGVCYGRHQALDGVTLSAVPGEILGILGPNGSGKSSLVKAIAGIVPFSGTVRFEGRPERPAALGYMPQDHHSKAALTVLETILLGRLGRLGLRVTDADLEVAGCILREIGIEHLAMRDLAALSGGQRQLVFLAQALASSPSVLLLDEPFSALDIRHQLEVAALLARLTRERSLTTILVLHDLPMAARLADKLALLNKGHLIATGECGEVLLSPAMREVFQIEFDTARLETGRIEIRSMHLQTRGEALKPADAAGSTHAGPA